MKELNELIEHIKNYSGKNIKIMEVCGTHTHEIFRQGIRNILPSNITLISGPGCPVCVTPNSFIDEAIALALENNCTITTFGDLVRVPGSQMSLAEARAKGAKINVVYSPLDAENYAKEHPDEQVVFLSVGFETTVPANALSVLHAKKDGLDNYSILTSNKTMDNAYAALKDSADAFLYPGHVSVITGTAIYDRLKEEGISGVVCGFTSHEILSAICAIIDNVETGKPFFLNCYPSVVKPEGNPAALKIIHDMMKSCDATWRGLGVIKNSGLELNDEYANFDARKKYNLRKIEGKQNPACRCGEILQGKCRPDECPCFGKNCTPEHPIGACMVSSEGSCSAFYKYGANNSL
ncbi:MAG: hydrogenase formation protein HypD [Treponema sp.]|uniref:hydrogenase formation protein HypD n=1 Tax=Treponema sp. TaxID=166 RepID=UPI00298D7393|nr:hydrogenase formation protein HypD [uncultured Treponema sp.]MBR0154446.1 hydrogenase formation protein HypD [Treponema sp.]